MRLSPSQCEEASSSNSHGGSVGLGGERGLGVRTGGTRDLLALGGHADRTQGLPGLVEFLRVLREAKWREEQRNKKKTERISRFGMRRDSDEWQWARYWGVRVRVLGGGG